MADSPKLARRLKTIPAVVAGWVLVVAAFPVLMAVGLIVDVGRWVARRTPWMASRLVIMLLAYLTAEVVGLAALALIWLTSRTKPTRLLEQTAAVQRAWAAFLFSTVCTVFALRVEASGLDVLTPSPYLILGRHTSIIDNLLPSRFITRPHRIHVRYVMKTELLADPAIDVAGSRLPNHFVSRGSGEGDRALAALRELAETMGDDEACLIYPEGTRFTAAKQKAALSRLTRTNRHLASIAEHFRSVLPPRLGGALALLEACRTDVVVMAHRGLDGFARVADIWRGGLVRSTVVVEFWRIPRDEIPGGRRARSEWLFDLWGRLDRWVVESETAPA